MVVIGYLYQEITKVNSNRLHHLDGAKLGMILFMMK